MTLEGTIKGGTILDTGDGFNFHQGTLDNVKYRGDLVLNIPVYGEALTIQDGLVLTGADGTGKGTMEIGAGAVFFRGTQTFNNATVTLGTDNKFTVSSPGADKLKLTVTPSTGAVGGSFTHADGKTRMITGLLVPTTPGRAEGLFAGTDEPGVIEIVPTP